MKLPMRKDVPVEETWDLSILYKTEEELLADEARCKELAAQITADYRGRLNDPETINRCMDAYMELLILMDRVGHYAELSAETDYYNAHYQELSARVSAGAADIHAQLSFIESEILACEPAVIEGAVTIAAGAKCWLEDLLRRKPHRLSPETEQVLAALSPALQTPYAVYNMAKLADMKFDSFTVNGKEYPLGYSLFEDDYEYSADTAVRRAAFEGFYQKLRQYENATAAAYNGQVTREKLVSKARGFRDVFEALLFDQQVTREMYDRQIDLITARLAPHMRKYARLLQKVHRLDRMTYADLHIAVDPDYDPKVTIAQAKAYCKDALAILGDDYVSMVEEAFDKRWFDFAKNQGKCTGGFCASPYRGGSFILLTWNDRMSDVMTVVHELGHAGHFRSCGRAQSILGCEVSRYLLEAPSTMNELLLSHHLLKTASDKRFRRWVLANMVGGTYYHNCVTHLLEAWYQREVYRMIDAGGSVNAEVLNSLFRKNLENFWGDAVELPEGSELTWMRQPHYYMGLYSYTYSAGLTLATQACKRIEAEGAPAVEDWKKLLAAGGTLPPLELAGLAGIDLSTDAALIDTIETIGGMIDEICELTRELDGIELD